jgi:hypothetical protein
MLGKVTHAHALVGLEEEQRLHQTR